MPGSRLEIHIMPQHAVLLRTNRWLRGAVEKLSEIRAQAYMEDNQAWDMRHCGELLDHASGGGNLHVVFSDLWARYHLVQLGDTVLNEKDAMALARAQFICHYPGADYSLWPLRLAQQGKRLLVAGMNPLLLDAIRQMTISSGRRLVRAEPLFARVFDQYQKELAGSDGWILFNEPGMLIVAFMEKKQFISLHCQRREEGESGKAAQLLLERQAALIDRPAGEVRSFSYYCAPPTLLEPWRVRQLSCISFETHSTGAY